MTDEESEAEVLGDRLCARTQLADQIYDAKLTDTIWMKLYDGPTPIVAYPSAEQNVVVITISEALGLHAIVDAEHALRLSGYLAWAAHELLREKPEEEPQDPVPS